MNPLPEMATIPEKHERPEKPKIKHLFKEFVTSPSSVCLRTIMRRAKRIVKGTSPSPVRETHCCRFGPTPASEEPTSSSWLFVQFAAWKNISLPYQRDDIITNFKDIAYHLNAISKLSRQGHIYYSRDEQVMYYDVLAFYEMVLTAVFLDDDRPLPSHAPIPIPALAPTPMHAVKRAGDVNTYSPHDEVGNGITGRAPRFGGCSEWDIG
jgi:hypothetical protein